MPMTPVFVTLGAYGADLVRRQGQAHFLPTIAAAGAAGAEIRRELFPVDERPPLESLRRSLAAAGLQARYSVPFELWAQDGTPTLDGLTELLDEAEALGAEVLKVALGHYAGSPSLDGLREIAERTPVRILVENDQTPHGGSLRPMAEFVEACTHQGVPIGFTFDIGNWHWTGTDPMLAARTLAPHVRYVHCKAVQTIGERLVAVAPDAADAGWRDLLHNFPRDLPRAIEFPLEGADLEAVTRRYVRLLASA